MQLAKQPIFWSAFALINAALFVLVATQMVRPMLETATRFVSTDPVTSGDVLLVTGVFFLLMLFWQLLAVFAWPEDSLPVALMLALGTFVYFLGPTIAIARWMTEHAGIKHGKAWAAFGFGVVAWVLIHGLSLVYTFAFIQPAYLATF